MTFPLCIRLKKAIVCIAITQSPSLLSLFPLPVYLLCNKHKTYIEATACFYTGNHFEIHPKIQSGITGSQWQVPFKIMIACLPSYFSVWLKQYEYINLHPWGCRAVATLNYSAWKLDLKFFSALNLHCRYCQHQMKPLQKILKLAKKDFTNSDSVAWSMKRPKIGHEFFN